MTCVLPRVALNGYVRYNVNEARTTTCPYGRPFLLPSEIKRGEMGGGLFLGFGRGSRSTTCERPHFYHDVVTYNTKHQLTAIFSE